MKKLEESLDASEFSTRLNNMKDKIKEEYIPLSQEEIDILMKQGNFAEDWSLIRKRPEVISLDRIWHNHFFGACSFSNMIGKTVFQGKERFCGIYHSRICDSIFDEDVLVSDVTLLQNQIVGKHAILYNIKELSCSPNSFFGLGTIVKTGPETGGRSFLSCVECDMDMVSSLLVSNRQVREEAEEKIFRHVSSLSTDYGIVEEKCVISNSGVIRNSYIGPSTKIDNILIIENTCLYGTHEEPVTLLDGLTCKNSILHRGVMAKSMAIIDSSVLFDFSEVSNHGNVQHSWIGINSSIAEGEVTSCFLGPFIAAHHQSLLISAFWPDGKGNIAYGANVGSNHTGRLPDQEVFVGEGVFFGLGVNLKYPANFKNAQYSIFAAGISVLPQKIEMPFSLVREFTSSSKDNKMFFNEILPGWILSNNIYAVRRNEMKYLNRNKSSRYSIPYEVFRPVLIDAMIEARARLTDVSGREYYSDEHIEGLGKNYMTEKSRLNAVDAYTFYISYYALENLFEVLFNKKSDMDTKKRIHAQHVFESEMSSLNETKALMIFKDMLQKEKEDLMACLKRDMTRGVRVFSDYMETHVSVQEDPVVSLIIKRNEERSRIIDQYMDNK